MTIRICPNCRQNFVVDNACGGDVIHQCSDYLNSVGPTLAQEDVKVVGNWEDYTGSGTVNSPGAQKTQGTANKLWGTTPQIEQGAKLPSITVRGKNAQLYRQRGYLHYIPNASKIEPGPQREMPEASEIGY